MAGKKGRSGRKPFVLEPEQLRYLAKIGVPINRMAILLGVSHDTLEHRLRPQVEAARAEGERDILATTYKHASRGNTRLLELSLINRCGWTNRPEVAINLQQNNLTIQITQEEIKTIEEKADPVRAKVAQLFSQYRPVDSHRDESPNGST